MLAYAPQRLEADVLTGGSKTCSPERVASSVSVVSIVAIPVVLVLVVLIVVRVAVVVTASTSAAAIVPLREGRWHFGQALFNYKATECVAILIHIISCC